MKLKFCILVSALLSVVCGFTSLSFSYIVKKIIDNIGNEKIFHINGILGHSIILLFIVLLVNLLREGAVCKTIQYSNVRRRNALLKTAIVDRTETDFLSVLSNDINTIEMEYTKPVFDLIMYFSMFCFCLGRLLAYSTLHGMVIFGFAICSIFISIALKEKMGSLKISTSSQQEKYVSRISDLLRGSILIRQFGTSKEILEEQNKENDILEKIKAKSSIFFSIMNGITTVFSMTMFLTSFLLGAYLVFKGKYTLGIMMGTIQLINNIVEPLRECLNLFNKISGAKTVVKKVEKLTKIEDESGEEVEEISTIKVKKLNFSYDNNFEINSFSYSFEKGKKYAVVGENGSGKTTFLSLLAKEYEVEKGMIFYDDKDSSEIRKTSVYDHISFMNQQVFLFNDTIEKNITMYGKYNKNDYQKAIKESGVLKFLDKLQGEDQYIVECNGENMSGGQRQRIALARVLMKKKKIIVLDEAFSSLDVIAEKEIINDIMKLECMVIFITHSYDKEILRKCDDILVMKKGRLVENGKFDELIQIEGYFSKLYHFKGENR